MKHFIYLYISCILAVTADMLLVWAAKADKQSLAAFFAGIAINLVAATTWTYSIKIGMNTVPAILTYCVLTFSACAAMGVFLFGEKLSTGNVVGIILAVASIVLISK